MRKFSIVFVVFAAMLYACGSSPKSSENTDEQLTEQEEAIKKAASEKIDDCDKFLDEYETWVDNYLKLMEKYKKNPMDATTMQEYLKVAQEGTKWRTKWKNKHIDCKRKKKK